MLFLSPIGQCDVCGSTAFIGSDSSNYCTRHSSLINDIDPDTVIDLQKELDGLESVAKVEHQPLGFLGGVLVDEADGDEVREVIEKYDYTVAPKPELKEHQFVVEPKNAKVPYRHIEEFLKD